MYLWVSSSKNHSSCSEIFWGELLFIYLILRKASPFISCHCYICFFFVSVEKTGFSGVPSLHSTRPKGHIPPANTRFAAQEWITLKDCHFLIHWYPGSLLEEIFLEHLLNSRPHVKPYVYIYITTTKKASVLVFINREDSLQNSNGTWVLGIVRRGYGQGQMMRMELWREASKWGAL